MVTSLPSGIDFGYGTSAVAEARRVPSFPRSLFAMEPQWPFDRPIDDEPSHRYGETVVPSTPYPPTSVFYLDDVVPGTNMLWRDMPCHETTVAGGYDEPMLIRVAPSGIPRQWPYALMGRDQAEELIARLNTVAALALGLAHRTPTLPESPVEEDVDPTVFGQFRESRVIRAKVRSFGPLKPFVVPDDFAE